MVFSKFRSSVSELLKPLGLFLAKHGAKPWHMTLTGFSFSILFVYLALAKYLLLTPVFLLLAGFFDVLDGLVAKVSNKVSLSGAYLDSMVDRLSDIVIYAGFFFLGFDMFTVFLATSLTLTLTYSKARLENLGIREPRISLFERSDRIIVLTFILILYIVNSPLSYAAFAIYTVALTIIVTLRLITGYMDLRK